MKKLLITGLRRCYIYPASMNIITITVIFLPSFLPTLLIIFMIGMIYGRFMEVQNTFKELK